MADNGMAMNAIQLVIDGGILNNILQYKYVLEMEW
jgi:hypothetical protein